MAHRILAKAALTVIRPDIQEVTESVQLCAGQIASVESAIHAVHDCFSQEGTEAVLLVDAINTFNSFNHNVALRNMSCLPYHFHSPHQHLQGPNRSLYNRGMPVIPRGNHSRGPIGHAYVCCSNHPIDREAYILHHASLVSRRCIHPRQCC